MALYPLPVISAVEDALKTLGYSGTFDYNTTRRIIGHVSIPKDVVINSVNRQLNEILQPSGLLVKLSTRSSGTEFAVQDILVVKTREWEPVEGTIYSLFLSWNESAVGSGIGFTNMGDSGVNVQLETSHIAKIAVVEDRVAIRPGMVSGAIVKKFGLPVEHGVIPLKSAGDLTPRKMALIKRRRQFPIGDPQLIHKIVEELIEIVGWHASTDEVRDKAVSYLKKQDHEYHTAAIG